LVKVLSDPELELAQIESAERSRRAAVLRSLQASVQQKPLLKAARIKDNADDFANVSLFKSYSKEPHFGQQGGFGFAQVYNQRAISERQALPYSTGELPPTAIDATLQSLNVVPKSPRI